MRHATPCGSALPRSVLTLPVAMVRRPVLALLMAPARLAHTVSARGCRARWRAVAVAPVAATTEQELPTAPRAAPPDKLLHASAIASAMDSASRPCEAMRVGSACLTGRPAAARSHNLRAALFRGVADYVPTPAPRSSARNRPAESRAPPRSRCVRSRASRCASTLRARTSRTGTHRANRERNRG